MRAALLLLLFFRGWSASAQMVLHYTETSGYDHGTRVASYQFFQDIGQTLGFTVVDDNDGSQFDQLGNLLQFDAIVFSNTSGAAILNAQQQANFMAYVDSGGSVLGIHAATDTYRHSTANGNNSGAWDFYAELLGASVQENPNHVSGTPLYNMWHVAPHLSTASLPDPWAKNEEYYYWENGYLRPDNVVVLEVEETVGPNGLVNSYDAPRPMSWCRELPPGGRMFYTALGHAASNFTSDTLFREHIEGAMGWLMELPSAIAEIQSTGLVTVTEDGCVLTPAGTISVQGLDIHGRTVSTTIQNGMACFHASTDAGGLYFLECRTLAQRYAIQVVLIAKR